MRRAKQSTIQDCFVHWCLSIGLFVYLSPRNRVGGDIGMWPFVCGWVSAFVCPSRSALWARYGLQILPLHFQTWHVSCSWWEEELYWFWVTASKVKVKFGTLSIKPCGHNTGYSLCAITFKLHMQVVDDPIDFGSWGQRSRSTLPSCEGMPRFALSSLSLSCFTYGATKFLVLNFHSCSNLPT